MKPGAVPRCTAGLELGVHEELRLQRCLGSLEGPGGLGSRS